MIKPINECTAPYREEEIKEYVHFPERLIPDSSIVVATAAGNGLTDFGIYNADFLFFSTATKPKIGDIVLVRASNNGTMVRQLLIDIDKEMYILHASGMEPREDIYIAAPEIIGVLAYTMRRYRQQSLKAVR